MTACLCYSLTVLCSAHGQPLKSTAQAGRAQLFASACVVLQLQWPSPLHFVLENHAAQSPNP
uniref:Uncharacterized protein n=1 Tax=Bionectria ochroleuca TaxID=29856 RepID=A0A0B7KGZ4_BIOOC